MGGHLHAMELLMVVNTFLYTQKMDSQWRNQCLCICYPKRRDCNAFQTLKWCDRPKSYPKQSPIHY